VIELGDAVTVVEVGPGDRGQARSATDRVRGVVGRIQADSGTRVGGLEDAAIIGDVHRLIRRPVVCRVEVDAVMVCVGVVRIRRAFPPVRCHAPGRARVVGAKQVDAADPDLGGIDRIDSNDIVEPALIQELVTRKLVIVVQIALQLARQQRVGQQQVAVERVRQVEGIDVDQCPTHTAVGRLNDPQHALVILATIGAAAGDQPIHRRLAGRRDREADAAHVNERLRGAGSRVAEDVGPGRGRRARIGARPDAIRGIVRGKGATTGDRGVCVAAIDDLHAAACGRCVDDLCPTRAAVERAP